MSNYIEWLKWLEWHEAKDDDEFLMRSWSISAGRIFGVEIRIHWTFYFLLPLFVWCTEYAARRTPNQGRSLALVGIIFAAVLVHELGHALVAQRSGVRVKSITLLPIGGITQLDDSQPAVDSAAPDSFPRSAPQTRS